MDSKHDWVGEKARRGFLHALEDPNHPVWDSLLYGMGRRKGILAIWAEHPPLENGDPDPDHCIACRECYEMKTRERCQALTIAKKQCRWYVRFNKDGHGVCSIHMRQNKTKYYVPPPDPPYVAEWDKWRDEARKRMAS
jgi:hypothetical protein